ncbi:MAG TPA: hypothetical protein VFS67_19440 [Polyangiaceae bacterium]|nr:hypothetical protein [Polyangiaceae bacterium]
MKHERGLKGNLLQAALILLSCHANPAHKASAEQPAASASAKLPAISTPAVPAPGAAPSSSLPDDSPRFLAGTPGESISLYSLRGPIRVVVPQASAWLYDPGHALLWFLDDTRFAVADLRNQLPAIKLAKNLPPASSIWIEWPSSEPSPFVRPETGCEDSAGAIELKISRKPGLRLLEEHRRVALSPAAEGWLQQQLARSTALPPARDFSPGAQRVVLPQRWSGCEEPENCGLSVPFGNGPLRLVLVQEKLEDCTHRACLLFNPETQQFASPPVLVDATGAPHAAAPPPAWSDPAHAIQGSCGPYLFDASGAHFATQHYLCRADDGCQDLGADFVGWLEPGPSVGAPG